VRRRGGPPLDHRGHRGPRRSRLQPPA